MRLIIRLALSSTPTLKRESLVWCPLSIKKTRACVSSRPTKCLLTFSSSAKLFLFSIWT